MTQIKTFFAAWGMTSDAERAEAIQSVLVPEAVYIDPRTDALTGPRLITDYVAQFTRNAPGWTAEVLKADTVGQAHRVTVAFAGPGPDGDEMTQHGQYFIETLDDGTITRLTGFVGTGAPE